jgi:hypothetical protein
VVDADGKGRFVKLVGVSRGSPYTYSLFDFTVCGERM